MGDIQIKVQPKNYDVVIVGSGAGGGMAAYVLANAGLKVCVIEAGPSYDPAKDSNQLRAPWESPRRGASTKFRPFGDFDGCYWGWDIDGEPYTHVGDTKWEWWRARMVGGRTNHWGRISFKIFWTKPQRNSSPVICSATHHSCTPPFPLGISHMCIWFPVYIPSPVASVKIPKRTKLCTGAPAWGFPWSS